MDYESKFMMKGMSSLYNKPTLLFSTGIPIWQAWLNILAWILQNAGESRNLWIAQTVATSSQHN